MSRIWVLEVWDRKSKRWLAVAFDWYNDETCNGELETARRINKGEKFRAMEYIPITQAANEVKRQQEFKAQLIASAEGKT